MDSHLRLLLRKYISGETEIRARLIAELQRKYSLTQKAARSILLKLITTELAQNNKAALCCLVYELTLFKKSITFIQNYCEKYSNFSCPDIWDCINGFVVGTSRKLAQKITESFGLNAKMIHFGIVGGFNPANHHPPPWFRILWTDNFLPPGVSALSLESNSYQLMVEHHIGYYLEQDGILEYHEPWNYPEEDRSRIHLPVINVCNIPYDKRGGVSGRTHTVRLRVSLDSNFPALKRRLLDLAQQAGSGEIDATGMTILPEIY